MSSPDPGTTRTAAVTPVGGATRPGAEALGASHIDLLTVPEAAALLRVSDATIRNWIGADSIPYIQLPPVGKRRQYRIPLQGLLGSLEGNYDLRGALEAQNARMREAKLSED